MITPDCTARIRPFRPVNEVELSCGLGTVHSGSHAATLSDYAYPGSATVINWQDGDRRTFHGEWPGDCDGGDECVLPAGHVGRCAA